jgi:signal transduction histidine kinase/DNA-binding response OmpR family regulator
MPLAQETDVVLARQRARQIAGLLGFETQDQTRITTAVSEIARNAHEYAGGGALEFTLEGKTAPQLLVILVEDKGPGIRQVEAVLDGSLRSTTGMGLGIRGARRLMDQFSIETAPGKGTRVWLRKLLPKRAALVTPPMLAKIAEQIAADAASQDPYSEIRRQNQELLESLEALRRREEELVRLNDELQDTNRGVVALYAELEERADRLRSADELKSRFLSNMSHEFRTPLNSILGLTRLMLDPTDDPLGPEKDKQARFVRKSAESLLELVNDLLDIAKVEAGKIVVRPDEFAVAQLFGALRGMLRPILVGDKVRLIFDDGGVEQPLVTDESKISQILRNFISNAIKFTDVGEIRVSAALSADGETVTFAVKDTGIGIAPEDQELIFQEFTQIDSHVQRRVKGTGLGLPLSRKLAELLGGRVGVMSAVGDGSTFVVEVPRVYREAKPLEPLEPGIEVPAGALPVLLVEDDKADTLIYDHAFRGSRYHPVKARTIREAKQALDQVRPAAIVLDLFLFGDDTWRFLAELKQETSTRDIPLVIASSVEDRRKAHGLGADGYLLKPVERAALLGTLDRLVGGKRRVLLIDDEEVSRYLVRQFLGDGYEVQEASSGAEGLRLVVEAHPDVVVLDLNMPAMSGFEVLERLGTPPSVPVIVATSAALDEHDRRRLADAVAVLPKSALSPDVLTSAIEAALQGAAVGKAP